MFIKHTNNFAWRSANFCLRGRHTSWDKGIRTAELLDVAHMLQFYEHDSLQAEIAGNFRRKLRIKKVDSSTLRMHICLLKVGVE
jgi:hypothetical protein